MRILVLGYIVRGPLAGHTWHHLQYALGLARMGHDVYFLEDSDDFESCYDPVTHEMTSDPRFGLAYARKVFGHGELAERWAYYDAHTTTWHGPTSPRAGELCRTADLCLNVSGVNPLREWHMPIPVRVLIDTDPAFTQVRHLTDPTAMQAALRHNVFLTFGENVAREGCTIPADGLPWKPTRQPIVLDAWPVTRGRADGNFSTMMQWQSYPELRHEGRTYGPKSLSFPAYFELPAKVSDRLEVAIGGESAPRDRLREAGWIVSDPMKPSKDPWIYQRFILRSKAEFTVAKQAYVSTASGWFSDRSAEYLACGRPVVTQETGFSRWLETGKGLMAFDSLEEAALGMERISRDYERHCRAARLLAEEYFDARRVLSSLLANATVTMSTTA
ncbi:MAG TPA: glycosyltransferase [Candidatus Cybelea sp.]|nr:glycosyltransferase [Candidatus Cybelea sp.]